MKLQRISSLWDRLNRNKINSNWERIETVFENVDKLVIEGKLTPDEYAKIIASLNGLVKKGDIDVSDINKNLGKIDQTFLTDELLQQISGNAPINAVPANGSLTTQKYANKSVTSEKLDDNFLHRRRIETDESIDTIQVDGNYIVTAGNIGTFPNGDNSLWGMEVITIPSNWTHQTIFKLGDPSIKYTRLYRGGSVQELSEWVKVITDTNSIDDHSISTDKLGKNFLHRRRINPDENINGVTEDGTYIITAGNVGELPNNDKSAWAMEVSTIPSNWTHQTVYKLANPEIRYIRTVRIMSDDITEGEWKKFISGGNNVEDDNIYKILMIGNSYSTNATEYLSEISASAGVNVKVGILYRDGERLSSHYENAMSKEKNYFYYRRSAIDGVANSDRLSNYSFDDGLLDEDWDLILFQQRSGDAPDYSTYQPYLNDLKTYISETINNDEVKFGVHQTWSRSSTNPNHFEGMYTDIVDAYQKAMKDLDSGIIIPNGTSIQNARSNNDLLSVDDELTVDGSHLGSTGFYIAALTVFETLFSERNKKSITHDVSYKPEDVSEYHAYICRLAAKNAVLNPFNITEL